ncbi:MAG: membrane protein FxsA [Aliivibrio sp.]|uniref:FxsA family protein n=1 Tax=Aliivibrio sp. TaxID=1872443 RepID=UPI001A3E198F|nr:membrane protein FxsA [Aliivibrio sp.]
MFPVLLLLFIIVPMIEIGLFVQVGGVLGMWPTIFIVLVTAVAGASLVRSQGLQTLMSVQSKLQQGELPAQQIVEGIMLAVAGVLLLTPGFMTDAFGMLVLLPMPRAALAKQLMSRVKLNLMGGNSFSAGFGNQTDFNPGANPFEHDTHEHRGNTFEGEYDSDDDDQKKLK